MDNEFSVKAIDESVLDEVNGGNDGAGVAIVVGSSYVTRVSTGYLALRRAACYDANNEIGPLWNGSNVYVKSIYGDYAWVYVNYAAKGSWGVDVTGKEGYVNWRYLTR